MAKEKDGPKVLPDYLKILPEMCDERYTVKFEVINSLELFLIWNWSWWLELSFYQHRSNKYQGLAKLDEGYHNKKMAGARIHIRAYDDYDNQSKG